MCSRDQGEVKQIKQRQEQTLDSPAEFCGVPAKGRCRVERVLYARMVYLTSAMRRRRDGLRCLFDRDLAISSCQEPVCAPRSMFHLHVLPHIIDNLRFRCECDRCLLVCCSFWCDKRSRPQRRSSTCCSLPCGFVESHGRCLSLSAPKLNQVVRLK